MAQNKNKQDRSPKVVQKNKIDFELRIKELNWTENQRAFLDLALDPHTQIMIVKGCAGTSKTSISIFTMLQLLNQKKVSDLILVRGNVESADSKMGYLPGNSSEKIQPFMMPFLDKLDMFLSPAEIKKLESENRLVCQPLGFLRGLDYQVKALCLDEAQNSSVKEILTFLSRIGRYCKTFVCGDPEQADIKNSGFDIVYNLFNNQESRDQGIYCWEFTEEDVMRSDLCKFITKKFRELNNQNNHNQNVSHSKHNYPPGRGYPTSLGEIEEYSPSKK